MMIVMIFIVSILLTTYITILKADMIPPMGIYRPGFHIGNPIEFGPGAFSGVKPFFYNGYTSNLGGYNEGNKAYKDVEENGIGRLSLKGRDHMLSKSMEGIMNEKLKSKSNAAKQNYRHQIADAGYNHGGADYQGRVNNHGVGHKEGYGGFGSKGHKKGHKTSGFHKTYHNEESGKDTTFSDEKHDEVEEKFGKHYDDHLNDRKWKIHSSGLNQREHGHLGLHDKSAKGDAQSAGISKENHQNQIHKGYNKDKNLMYNKDSLEALRKNNHLSDLNRSLHNRYINYYG